jgi:hypothetical protein
MRMALHHRLRSLVNGQEELVQVSRSSALIQMKFETKAPQGGKEVAAFPNRPLRHFQKTGFC